MKKVLEYDKYKELENKYLDKVNLFANIRGVLFIIMIISFIVKYYYYEVFFNIVFILSLVMFFVMVMVHDKYFKLYNYYLNYVRVLDAYIDRENGKWKLFLDKGEDLIDDKLSYLSDLDILGDCSLFQYISVCKTLGGREVLFNKLSNVKLDEKEFNNAQEMIKELVENKEFCVKFQVMMSEYEGKGIHLTNEVKLFKNRLDDKFRDFLIGIVSSGICIILFILGLLNIISYSYFYGIFIFNLVVSFLYAYIYREEFNSLDKVIKYYGNLVSVFELVSKYKATGVKMKKISKNMNSSLGDIFKLRKLDSINSLKNNFLSNFLLNGICSLNLFLMYKYSLFLNKSLNNLISGIKDIEELEAMISLATIGIVRKDASFPVLSSDIGLKFSNLKHPLIDDSKCVSNDFDGSNGVNIITGSNMGGKTTFLRTIGINLILMQAGGYVCADSFCASYFKIFTSMRVMDNIDKGISTFYGELLRIKDMVDYVGKGNMLVLVDEIFKGTNYNDRMYGALEVVKKLSNDKTIAFITTHDFELCQSSRVKNYHVKEDYEGDRIIFDYKIRKGKCSSTNAKYLMKKLGIID